MDFDPSDIPPSTDWQWFGSHQSPKTIADAAEAEKDFDWLQKAYAWLYSRLNSEQKKGLPEPLSQNTEGPPREFVPVLSVKNDGDKGVLVFLKIDTERTYGRSSGPEKHESAQKHCFAAGEYVFELFRSLNHELGTPQFALQIKKETIIGGASISLSAIIAALGRILGTDWSDKIISTGGYNKETKKLEPVGSLDAKIKAAKRFGYERLVIVEGQPGIPPDYEVYHEMQIIKVNSDPLLALFDLLELANDGASDQRIAQLLTLYDIQEYRKAEQSEIEKVVSPFCKSHSRLVRHVAHDILSRVALRIGETEKAEMYRSKAERLEWHEYPPDWLGHFLRYEQTTCRAEIDIDSGILDDGNPDKHSNHREIDIRVEHLQMAIDNNFADTNDYFSALALKNIRAMRWRFLARLFRDQAHRLPDAWNDLIAYFEHWDRLWKHVKRIGRKDYTFERQRNYCIEALADEFALRRKLPQWKMVDEFRKFCRRHDFKINDAFDIVAKIHWNAIIEGRFAEAEVDAILEKADNLYDDRKNHPNFKPYELLLRYNLDFCCHLCSDAQRDHALNQLALADHLKQDLPKTSIYTILALRTRAVLERYGRELKGGAVVPPEGTPLRKIFDDLLSDPETLIARCPY
jgi:hypothetical protein